MVREALKETKRRTRREFDCITARCNGERPGENVKRNSEKKRKQRQYLNNQPNLDWHQAQEEQHPLPLHHNTLRYEGVLHQVKFYSQNLF